MSLLSISACADGGTEDELAGESSVVDSLEGKADSAVDGAYTYFEISRDFRKCVSPLCGGFHLDRLNRAMTTCHDGAVRPTCYTPELDFSESNLEPDLQGALRAAAESSAISPGVVAIVRGRFVKHDYKGFGNLGRFVVSEAWVAANEAVADGVFVRVRDSGVRCITTPCASIHETRLNLPTSSTRIHALDWSDAGLDEEETAELALEMVSQPYGIIVAGERYDYRENKQAAKGRTVTAAYRRLKSCYVGGCSSEICSDQENVISTCQWKDEYACYESATCEQQPDGNCGWTPTPQLEACLEQY